MTMVPLFHLNTCSNVVIYWTRNAEYRTEFRRILRLNVNSVGIL